MLLVGQHLGHRHLRLDDVDRAARVHAGDAAAAAVEIAHQVAGEIARRVHLDVHDRLEQRRPRARHRVLEGQRAAILNDSSFESTSWNDPSNTVTRKSTIG